MSSPAYGASTSQAAASSAGQLGNQQAAQVLGEAIAQVQRVIVGQEHMCEQLMVGLLAKGHILLEGVPGVAKTLAVRSFATVVGGDFADVPLCEAEDQTGCVVTYSSYRSTDPPAGVAFFGRGGDGTRAGCVNPAAVGGGAAAVQPYFLVRRTEGSLLGGLMAAQPFADSARTAEITTPWVTYPDLVEAECVSQGDYTYLSLTVEGDPADPRTDDIGGDLTPEWGMHLIDANVAMGDIDDLVTAQAQAYVG